MRQTRNANELRPTQITPILDHPAAGACLIQMGNTHVQCTASWIEGVPHFLKHQNQGWLTAEYSMLPSATHTRHDRDIKRGHLNGRTSEIQRLIGRSLRQAIDLKKIGSNTIIIDCDVLRADGGTRTASITGGCVALVLALQKLQYQKILRNDPFNQWITAVSVGICSNQPLLDLDYTEDQSATTDMNLVLNEHNHWIEIQGTGEKSPFSSSDLNQLLELGLSGANKLRETQTSVA
ncbi:ribonuclease PH [Gammaproteobacteria bacterium]|jgi:ribonuclease PH|nr:ribonuclease PH [Gammaproteobacteria bacterium]